MPQPPRAPSRPTAPSTLGLPTRPSLNRYRDRGSTGLDGRQVKPRGEEPQTLPPFMRWSEFYGFLAQHWQPGEHMSLVGQTGSGKTIAAREMLDIRDYVIVIGTKQDDDSLYEPFAAKGYLITDRFNPREWNVEQHPRVVFKAPLDGDDKAAEQRQADKIRPVLTGIYRTGGWTIFLDEAHYLTKDLGLEREMNRLWREGRSSHTTVVAGTQRPVNVPRNMWEMATHNIDFRITGKEDRDTAASYLGELRGLAIETMAILPKHEFLYVDSVEAIAVRSRVELPSR